MILGYDLKIEQSQKLVMTPELIQAIKILQFNTQELELYVDEELMNNPVLEQASAKEEYQDKREDNYDDFDDKYYAMSDNASKEHDAESDIDWKEYLKDRQYDDISYRSHQFKDPDKEENTYEHYTSTAEMLSEHLMIQLDIATKDPEMLRLGEYIIESLDDNGYMTLTDAEIAAATKADVQTVEKTVKMIQAFDPYGVGASTLSECLMIQMRIAGILDETYEMILTDFVDDVAANRIQKIAKALNISIEDLKHRIDVIRMMEPKPGREFAGENSPGYITPDIIVEQIEDDFIVLTNDDSVPELMVSSYYKNLLTEMDNDREVADYLTAHLNSAVRLINSIKQRKQTIWNVANAVVAYQKDFFRYGKKHLKPLTMKRIADEIGVHESTVSRAINGKYLQCSRGVFELKHFFNAGVAASDSAISSVSVKDFIKDLVAGEDPKHPYSDQDMAELLKAKGISISRRTVAKYRDEMQIMSSSKRKR